MFLSVFSPSGEDAMQHEGNETEQLLRTERKNIAGVAC